MRKGLLGVERLNTILQEYLNPPSDDKKEHDTGRRFREGDKVMQIKNNYQMEWEVRGKYGIPVDKGCGVFNGDMGIIREINTYAEMLTVELMKTFCGVFFQAAGGTGACLCTYCTQIAGK